MNLKYKSWGGVIRWALNLSLSHSPGCFNLIFNFKCSQSSVDCVHDLISLVTTSSAIEAGYYNVFCACKVSSPVECEGGICFLTTRACIPVGNLFLARVVFLNWIRSTCMSIRCGQVVCIFSNHEPETVPATEVSTVCTLKLGTMTTMAVCFLQRCQ